MSDIQPSMREIISLYEQDEHLWAAEQIAHLNSGEVEKLDRKNLAQYLEEMTQSDHRELRNRMKVLISHLLKMNMQPEKYGTSWKSTIDEQQEQILLLFKTVPSLKSSALLYWDEAYSSARKSAANETKIAISTFPAENPYTMDKGLYLEAPVTHND